jgi:serine/threonine protein kinase
MWSLGCTLVELASAKLPWHEQNFDNEFQAIKFIVEEEQIPKIESNWDHKIKYIISRCLERVPSKRITALQLLEQHELWE